MFAASLTQDGRGRSASHRGTPGIAIDGDDENEGDMESDHEMAAGVRAVQQARLWTPGGEVASAVQNGVNGDRELPQMRPHIWRDPADAFVNPGYGRSESPMTSQAGTASGGRDLSRKASRAIVSPV